MKLESCRAACNCLLFIKTWSSVSESHILTFELWNKKSSPKHTTEERILAATILSIVWGTYSLYPHLCPAMSHIWFFPSNGDAHQQTAQPLEPRSDIDIDVGQKVVFFLSYCYVFYIRVRIWVLARGNRGSSYRTLETKLESNLLQYYLIPFWSGAMDRNSRIFVSVIREHGILLNL